MSPDPAPRCPIDAAALTASARYPAAVCRPCAEAAVDLAGRPVTMGNIDMTGGFAATHRDDGSPCEQVTGDGRVVVRGVPCRAEEARFGGFVVQVLAP